MRPTRSRGDTEPNSWPVSEAWRRTVKLLPLSLSARPDASVLSVCERATRSVFMVSKRPRFSSVARSALPRGNRKLRAKPSLTRTTSPIWPSLATRSSKITSISTSPLRPPPLHRGRDVGLSSADYVGQKPKEARTLDRLGELTLFLRRDRRDAARHDLAALRYEALQQLDVLVIDLRRIGAGEWAALAAAKERPAAGSTSALWGHCHGYSSVAVGVSASSEPSRGRRSRSRGRSPRSPRSPKRSPRSPKRSPRSPLRSSRSRSRSARRIMAEGPSSCSSTLMVR